MGIKISTIWLKSYLEKTIIGKSTTFSRKGKKIDNFKIENFNAAEICRIVLNYTKFSTPCNVRM